MSTITIMVAANETVKIRLVSIHFDIFDFLTGKDVSNLGFLL